MTFDDYVNQNRDRLIKVEGEVLWITCPICEFRLVWSDQERSSMLEPCANCHKPVFTIAEIYPPDENSTRWTNQY